MKIAVVSDTHDNAPLVRAALARIDTLGVGLVLHCGDVTEPATLRLFAGRPVQLVFGNCDHRRGELRAAAADTGAELHESFGSLEAGGLRLAWTHGDDGGLLRGLAAADHYDFVFHGHTHQFGERQEGRTRVVNPGALQRARVKTFAVLDTDARSVEWVEVRAD